MQGPSTVESQENRAARTRLVCAPCDQFVPDSGECSAAAVSHGAFRRIFDDGRPCRPRDFLLQFLRRHLSRRYPGTRAESAEDLASRVVLALFETPPVSVPTPDLGGLRTFLAARAAQATVDDLRERQGRMRCGNCRYHHRLAEGRRCGHPSPDHPWSGKEVRASEDPRRFEPPCETFASGRVEDSVDGDDAATLAQPPGIEERLLRDERSKILMDALLVLQREDARLACAMFLAYFQGRENDEIARELKASVKTVIRYKQKGLARMRQMLAQRGIAAI